MRRGLIVAMVVAGLAVCAAVPAAGAPGRAVAPAPPAPAGAGALDFNGDELDDLAVGAPGEAVGAAEGAGAVNVLYGSLTGLVPSGLVFVQGSGGVPGASETSDGFGAALAKGDFNNDGDWDLAVGAPGERVGALAGAGAVTVLYGSDAGLAAGGSQLLTQGNVEAGDGFGAALAAGDFDGDGHYDLAVGAPGEDVGGRPDAGAVSQLLGGPSGLATSGTLLFQGGSGVAGAAEAGDRLGFSLAAGLFRNLTYDLAAGVPGEDVGATGDAGAVNVLNGSGAGLTGAGSRLLTQAQAETGDEFGFALSTGYYALDSYADLAVGAPGENVATRPAAGAVNLFASTSPAGLDSESRVLIEGQAVAQTAERFDRFGSALASGRYNGSPDDLVVGIPGEDDGPIVDAGAVTVIYELDGSLADRISDQLFQSNPEPFDNFGASLSDPVRLTQFDVQGQEDLAVGAAGETIGTRPAAGSVSVLFGTTEGFRTDLRQLFYQGRGGLGGTAEAGDRFGAALG